jgi:integration host factor subunit beta
MAGKIVENMVRSELVSLLTQKVRLLGDSDRSFDGDFDVERAVAALLDMMGTALAGGGRIEVRGFGSFSMHARPPRKGRNPKNGETVMVPAKAAVHFKSGQGLKDVVNQNLSDLAV